MTTTDLITRLRQRGVALHVDADGISYDAPRGALTDDLREKLRNRKAEVMAVLRGDWCAAAKALLEGIDDPDERQDLAYWFEERAAIAQFCGGLSRAEAERCAHGELEKAIFCENQSENKDSGGPGGSNLRTNPNTYARARESSVE
jgi:hypothetical protein